LNSPRHRANLLKEKFKDTGIGHGVTADGTHYWTQNFGFLE